MLVVDIESKAIQDGAPLLPKPVGIAVRWPDGRKEYVSFGHPEGNSHTWEQAHEFVRSIWHEEWVTHNGLTFDVPVLQHWFGLQPREPLLTHDTLFLAYLHNPHVRSLSLKDLAQDWLDMKPDERDEMRDWIIRNVPECRSIKKAGAFISEAPVKLVGPYAAADTEMTWRLFQHLLPVLETMLEPYNRERRLAPILVEMQNRGMRCSTTRLQEDYNTGIQKLHALDASVRRALATPDLNPGSNAELGSALQRKGFKNFLTTPSGAISVAKDSLDKALSEAPELRDMLRARNTLATLTGTFMHPWLEIAAANDGTIHASYNQVRSPDGFGTRTGRLSSNAPNFQNVPNDLGPEFPVMRSYLLPDDGHIWTCGDFKSQEPRLAAHFEDGALMQAYLADPELDPYLFVMALVGGITRKEAKTVFLGLLYAQGVALLAEKLETDTARASVLRNMVKAYMPDVVRLADDCKRRFSRGLPIRTLGGRLYYREPNAQRDLSYKALNTLIQGSAADQTKEALIFADKEIKLLDKSHRILGTVHDEYSVSHLPEYTKQVHEIMQLSARALHCDVPMRMDIFSGNTWAEAA